MLFGVLLCRFFGMMSGMQVVTVRDVSMMRDLLVVPARLMLGRFFVVASRMSERCESRRRFYGS